MLTLLKRILAIPTTLYTSYYIQLVFSLLTPHQLSPVPSVTPKESLSWGRHLPQSRHAYSKATAATRPPTRPRPDPAPATAAAFEDVPAGAGAVVVADPSVPAVPDGAAALDDPVAEGVAVLQVAAVGTVTPSELQNWMANWTAASVSAWLQVPTRQHAMPDRKFWSWQMHLASSDWQLPIWSPEVNLVTQPCCCGGPGDGKTVSRKCSSLSGYGLTWDPRSPTLRWRMSAPRHVVPIRDACWRRSASVGDVR